MYNIIPQGTFVGQVVVEGFRKHAIVPIRAVVLSIMIGGQIFQDPGDRKSKIISVCIW